VALTGEIPEIRPRTAEFARGVIMNQVESKLKDSACSMISRLIRCREISRELEDLGLTWRRHPIRRLMQWYRDWEVRQLTTQVIRMVRKYDRDWADRALAKIREV
jgi:hypothetical protein